MSSEGVAACYMEESSVTLIGVICPETAVPYAGWDKIAAYQVRYLGP